MIWRWKVVDLRTGVAITVPDEPAAKRVTATILGTRAYAPGVFPDPAEVPVLRWGGR